MPQVYSPARIKPLLILRDVGILFGLTFFGGVIIGVAFTIMTREATPPLAIGIINIGGSIIGFFIAGLLTVDGRWRHLWFVALFYWLGSLVNVFFFGVTVIQWVVAGAAIIVTMGIGGGLSALIRKTKPNEQSDPTLSSITPVAEQPPRLP
jgi:hypothetical protein